MDAATLDLEVLEEEVDQWWASRAVLRVHFLSEVAYLLYFFQLNHHFTCIRSQTTKGRSEVLR